MVIYENHKMQCWENLKMRGIIKLCAAALACLALVSGTAFAKNEQARGVWVSTVYNLDYPSRQGLSAEELCAEIDEIIANMEKSGLNTAYFQVRPCADSLYPSKIFPYSVYLTGVQGQSPPEKFDPLAYFIKKAHTKNIEVHAWINPYRVTKNAPGSLDAAFAQLAQWHPAVQDKSLVRLHSDGNLYFDPALPAVQKLVVDGACEIAQNYDIDGIHLDDYFYPSRDFDDSSTFAQYGAGRSLGDFRRDNVTALISSLSQELHKIKPKIKFGVSPFGIWANKSDGVDGSETSGAQSYFDHYADTRTWVKSGLLDYISPQLYWNIGNKDADFIALLDWWTNCVEGTKCELIPGLASYRTAEAETTSPWFGTREISKQISMLDARNKGYIFFRYGSIADDAKMTAAVSPKAELKKEKLALARPQTNISTDLDCFYFCGMSDYSRELKINGQNVAQRGSDGSWGVLLPLKIGKNTFEITDGKSKITREIVRTKKPQQATKLQPQRETILPKGRAAKLSSSSVSGRSYAYFCGEMVDLKKSVDGFSSDYSLPQPARGEITSYGTPIYFSERGKFLSISIAPANIGAVGADAEINFKTNKKLCDVYYEPNSKQGSSDFLLENMQGIAESVENGYLFVRGIGYIDASDAEISVKPKSLTSIIPSGVSAVGGDIEIKFSAEKLPASVCEYKGGKFEITMAGASGKFPLTSDLLQNSEATIDGDNLKFTFSIKDFEPSGWYFKSSKNTLTLVIRRKPAPTKTLAGVKIMLDAGHGGDALGAIGCNAAIPEKSVNLRLAQAVGKKLAAKGADVSYTRTNDADVPLQSRIAQSFDTMPDLFLSFHSNSAADNSDITTSYGVSTYFDSEIAATLAQTLAEAAQTSGRVASPAQGESKLYMCRQNFTTSILLENGFLPNPNEFYDITSGTGIDTLASAISDCICDYFGL